MKHMIKSQKEEQRELRQQELALKRQQQRLDLIRRINEENEKRIQIQTQVARLEKEEAEWIRKLQNTSQIQAAAFSELEVALNGDPARCPRWRPPQSEEPPRGRRPKTGSAARAAGRVAARARWPGKGKTRKAISEAKKHSIEEGLGWVSERGWPRHAPPRKARLYCSVCVMISMTSSQTPSVLAPSILL